MQYSPFFCAPFRLDILEGDMIMEIKKMRLELLKPADYNPRVDLETDDPDYESLKNSILRFGHVQPVVWNEDTGRLVGGHQSLKVLHEIGCEEVECVVVHMSEPEEKALNIALNKIRGRWDMDKLSDVMEELVAEGLDAFTGFCEKEVAKLIEEIEPVTISDHEIDISEFGEGKFKNKCPRCGFLY